jgi:hypothetical protein
VAIQSNVGATVNAALVVDGRYVAYNRVYGTQGIAFATAIIPIGSSYYSPFIFQTWMELR